MTERFRENTQRSLFKSVTFRIVVIVSDLIVVYVLTHRINLTLGITLFTNVASSILYFFHERVWNTIRWGKIMKKKVQ